MTIATTGQGPAGPPSLTQTTSPFIQPVAGSTAAVSVANGTWMFDGMPLFMQTGGSYKVTGAPAVTPGSTAAIVTLTNTGGQGNASPGTTVAPGQLLAPSGSTGSVGEQAFTLTSAVFTMPPADGTTAVLVSVGDSSWAPNGMTIFIATAGYMKLAGSPPDPTHLSLVNPLPIAGVSSPNAAPGTLISQGEAVTTAGPQGGQGIQGIQGIQGTIGPAGPSGVLGQVTQGSWTPINDGGDWTTTVGPGTTAPIYTLLDGPLAAGEQVELDVAVMIQQVGGTAFDGFRRTILVQNNGGTVTTPSGGTSDVDLTSTPHSTALPGLLAQIVIQGTTLVVQGTTPTGISCVFGVSVTVDRRLAPGTAIVPIVQSVSVNAGPNTGGTISVAHGLHFVTPNMTTSFSVDGVPVTSFHIDSDSQITFTTAATATPGTGNVLASSAAGGTPLVNGWTYTSGVVPVVTSTDVSSGLSSGGTVVHLGGLHFQTPLPVTTLTFEGVVAASFTIVDDTHITATTSSTAGGAVGDILARSTAGGTPLTNGWTYIGPPTLTAMVLDIGQYEGGSKASGTGTALTGATITFNGVNATNIVIGGGGTTFVCTVPAFTGSVNGGYVSVGASNTAGTATPLTGVNGFFYLPSQTYLFHVPRFGTTPATPTDGSAISAWLDATGTLTSQTQTTPANEPAYVAAGLGLNGQPAIRTSPAGGVGAVPQFFNGVPAASFGALTMTWLWVGSKHTTVSSTLFEADENTSGTGTGATELLSATTQALFSNGSSTTTQTATTMLVDTAYCVSARYDGTHATVRVNGADGPQGNFAIAFTGLVRYGFGNPLQASGAQIDNAFELISLKSWSTADFTSFSAYTNHKWAIANA